MAVVCSVCMRPISSVRIDCAVCANVSLCVNCFGTGASALELGHLSSHAYRVQENLASFCLYDKDWTAEEELLLLQGIDMYGLGNWRCVSLFSVPSA